MLITLALSSALALNVTVPSGNASTLAQAVSYLANNGDGVDTIRLSANIVVQANDLQLSDSQFESLTIRSIDPGQPATIQVVNSSQGFRTFDGLSGLDLVDVHVEAVGSSGRVVLGESGTITLDNVTASGFDASSDGGAIVWVTNGATAVVRDGVFSNSQSTGDGGYFRIEGGGLELTDTVISGGTGGKGGAIHVKNNAPVTILRSTFEGITSTDSGANGVIYVEGGTASITDSVFIGNSHTGDGASILGTNSPALIVAGSRFCANSSSGGEGSGVYLENGTLTLSGSMFHANTGSILRHASDSTSSSVTANTFIDSSVGIFHDTNQTGTIDGNLFVDVLLGLDLNAASPTFDNAFYGTGVVEQDRGNNTGLFNDPAAPSFSVDALCRLEDFRPPTGTAVVDGAGVALYGALDAPSETDADGDGEFTPTDCDDQDPNVNSSAIETCDGVDTNCSGDETDATDQTAWYPDVDGDGFGEQGGTAMFACDQPAGFVATADDCVDTDPTIDPDEPETCNGVDNNCSGDETDATDQTAWYPDVDGDGFGEQGGTAMFACDQPTGFVATADDCVDTDPTIDPDEPETCNGVDNNCSGDETDATDPSSWYPDNDDDGFGEQGAAATLACDAPAGFVASSDDCNDTSAAIDPDEPETCNGVDNNCSGNETDATDPSSWYPDDDNDGFGEEGVAATLACDAPAGFVASSDDCVDTDPTIDPDEPETCNGVDNNCSGNEDDATDPSSWYPDDDNDGFGEEGVAATLACDAPAGFVASSDDCDDTSAAIDPAEPETCNGVDNNCSGDETDATDRVMVYADADADGFGAGDGFLACADSAAVTVDGDCDDSDADVYPGAPETCDGFDSNCANGETDAADAVLVFVDGDGDGLGAGTPFTACLTPGLVENGGDCDDTDRFLPADSWADVDGDGFGRPGAPLSLCDLTGRVENADDCDDALPGVNPAGLEICNGLDDDCNQLIDDNANGGEVYYLDADLDGQGTVDFDIDGGQIISCEPVSGYADNALDCDDTTSDVRDGIAEVCANGIDDNCNGEIDTDAVAVDWYPDVDDDGFGDANAIPVNQCAPPQTGNYASTPDDCDDANDAINPGAIETCGPDDEDCDNVINEPDASGQSVFYVDVDGDGVGAVGADSVSACTAPATYPATSVGDCDDNDADRFPGAADVCDGLDNDCDDVVDQALGVPVFLDGDGDGVGGGAALFVCATGDEVPQAGDCDDDDAAISPFAEEICDGIDNDCSGIVDDLDVFPARWLDDDGDGYGSTPIANACLGVAEDGDCDDSDPTVHPGADEGCNQVDNDCDGAQELYYADLDRDGVGFGSPLDECLDDDQMARVTGDCDDADATRAEECSGVYSVPPPPAGCTCDQGGGRSGGLLGLLGLLGLVVQRRAARRAP